MGIFRSEEFVHKRIRIPRENATSILNELGYLEDSLEFIDLNKENKLEQHFSAPLVVNEYNGRYRLIDGNHRIESVKQNTINDLRDASIVANEIIEKVVEYPKPPTIDELLNVLTEETESVTTSEPSLVNLAAEHITKEVKLEEKADSFQQPAL